MAELAVDGLVSGLSTSSLITQLMQVEALPKQSLSKKVTSEQSAVTAYQSISGKMLSLQTTAEALTKDTAWNALSVSSSSSTVKASATSSAATGTLRLNVTSVASPHMVRSDTVTGLTGTVATSAGIDIVTSSGTTHVATSDTSLSGVVSAINAKSGLGVVAQSVQVSPGVYRMQLTSTKTGETSEFSVQGLTVGTDVSAEGSDAAVTVGTGPGAYTVTAASNTFSDLIPGVTFTVAKLENDVTLTTSRNPDAIAQSVQSMVDAYNAAITDIGTQTASGTEKTKPGALAGDGAVRQLRQAMGIAVSDPLTGSRSLDQYGIELDRYGKATFDKTAFLNSYNADPASTRSGVAELGTRLTTLAKSATDATKGSLTMAVKGRQDTIDDLNDRIADWDVRLDLRRAGLQRQFSAMEVALSKLKDQSSWLAGQIAGLPSASA
jgi:flagellar hook-associated protein 2